MCLVGLGVFTDAALADESVRRIDERFATTDVTETPDFQKHIVPLLGRLGCNGRACHGSFQGQGGFRLSLFGYDFPMDHENLTKGDNPRIDREQPAESLILQKPTLSQVHKGGKKLEPDSWQYRVLERWIQAGAIGTPAKRPDLLRLEVTPREIQFSRKDETVKLQVMAVWSDGAQEDVTPLCRFQTNNDQIAEIDATAVVTAREPGDTHVVAFYDNAVEPVPVTRPVTDLVGDKYPTPASSTPIDQLVVAKLRRLGVVPSDQSTDAEFLRRVSLDITGTLPTSQEVEAFLADGATDKRTRKIDALLEQPGYAAWWTTWLCDVTGNSAAKLQKVGVNQGSASREWYDWIHRRVADNVPYDQIVSGIILAVSREPNESYTEYCRAMSEMNQPKAEKSFATRSTMPHFWARENFRTQNERVLGIAHAFLGVRIQCAECHKHPFDQWSQDDFKAFAGFFGRVSYGRDPATKDEFASLMDGLGLKEMKGNDLQKQMVRLVSDGKTVPFQELFVTSAKQPTKPAKGEKNKSKTLPATTARLPGGPEVPVSQLADPRSVLMDWLRSADNPYFAKAFVNRVWARYFNTGIIEPTDDLSRANPPSNGPLLDYLATEFVRRGYDMKWLHREIANSQTYQLSWRPNETNRLDERNFSHAVPRRLPAEVAYDAVRQATATDAEIREMQTDMSDRAIAQSGTPAKGQKAKKVNNYALQIFGKSQRENNCDCDRSSEPSLLQTIYLHNDNDTLALIEQSKWITQVLQPVPKSTPKEAKGAVADPATDLAQVEARLEKARAAGETDRIAKLEKRLAALRRRGTKAPEASAVAADSEVPKDNAKAAVGREEVIRQAYLRTLGRPPVAEEVARGMQFMDDASTPVAGLRGLLWALLNTKEFIVNH